jgi:hypothetical protein
VAGARAGQGAKGMRSAAVAERGPSARPLILEPSVEAGAHSIVVASAWEPTPWRAVQRAAWDALKRRATGSYLRREPWDALRAATPVHVLGVADDVWNQRELYVRWPQRAGCFWPGCTRQIKYHVYTAAQVALLRAAGIALDTRSNGPAIMAYLSAGGERPARETPGRKWSIHHVYDGKFPAPGRTTTVRAVNDGRYFTEAAGLVAVHPIADTLADEVPYFAWWLRREAFNKFGFDPDGGFL